jgi:hypothetical protein
MTLGVSVATLTRPFGATSPIEGEVMCALPPPSPLPWRERSTPEGRRVRGKTLRCITRILHMPQMCLFTSK